MATHKYVFNKEGGYYYRFYPNLPKTITKITDEENPTQLELFALTNKRNQPEDSNHANVARTLSGKFIMKEFDSPHYIVKLLSECEITITDINFKSQETRTLYSILHIAVPPKLYNHAFKDGKLYCLTIDSITEL